MARRHFTKSDNVPRNLFELSLHGGSGASMRWVFTPDSLPRNIHQKEWYQFIHDDTLLADYIAQNFKFKPFNEEVKYQFEAPFDYPDYMDMCFYIKEMVTLLYVKNEYNYDKLWDAMTLEFNPLWNVDGTETTTRTLEKDGSTELADTGHDDVIKSGKDYNIKSGYQEYEKEGEIINDRLGDDTTTYEGQEENKRNGDRSVKTQGGEIKTHKESTTDADSLLIISQDSTEYGASGVVGDLGDSRIETETYTNLKDEKTFTDRTDTIHHDVSDTTSFDAYKETTTYQNVKDEMNYGSTVKNQYYGKHTTTYDTVDTERTTYERHGNIGVTKSTELLESLADMTQNPLFDFTKIVARDIMNEICNAVY